MPTIAAQCKTGLSAFCGLTRTPTGHLSKLVRTREEGRVETILLSAGMRAPAENKDEETREDKRPLIYKKRWNGEEGE